MDATASALAAELQQLHAAYERLVAENGALKRAAVDHHSVVIENEALRRKMKTKGGSSGLRPPPSTFDHPLKGPGGILTGGVTPGNVSNPPPASIKELHKMKDENKLLRQQVLKLNANVRAGEKEIERLHTELGQRQPIREAVADALALATGRVMADIHQQQMAPSAAEELPVELEMGWTLEKWLEGAELPSVVASILAAGLRAADPPNLPRAEKALLAELGGLTTISPLSVFESILRDVDLSAMVAEKIAVKAQRLAKQVAANAQARADIEAAKHAEAVANDPGYFMSRESLIASTTALVPAPAPAPSSAAPCNLADCPPAPLGVSTHFYAGLAGLVDTPDHEVLTMEAMRREHCDGADNDNAFISVGGICTTPLIEWWFVYDPEQQLNDAPEVKARLADARIALGLKAGKWPIEPPRDIYIDQNTGHAPDGAWVPRKAESRMTQKMRQKISKVNGQLVQVGETAFTPEEFIACRLYTGPMGDKYSLVLNAIGAQKSAELSEQERAQFLGTTADAALLPEDGSEQGTYKLLASYFAVCNKGNKYTATLTTLSNALGKLGRVPGKSTPLYKPISELSEVPASLLTPGAVEEGGSGGVVFGFTRLEADRQTAMEAASKTKTQLILEVHQGGVDRAPTLDWLSQYESSDKCHVLPPVSCLEVREQKVSGPSIVAGGTLNGGEVRVLVVDSKIGWGRDAAKPGRLAIAQLERTRGQLEGKLAETKALLENAKLQTEAMKKERDDIRHSLTVTKSKLRTATAGQSAGNSHKAYLDKLKKEREEAQAEQAMAEGGSGEARPATAAAAPSSTEDAALAERIRLLEAEKEKLARTVAESTRFYQEQAQLASRREQYNAELMKYKLEKLSYGMMEDATAAAGGGGGGAEEEGGGKSPTVPVGDPSDIVITGGTWNGGELSVPVPLSKGPMTDSKILGIMQGRIPPSAKPGTPGRRTGGRHTAVKLHSAMGGLGDEHGGGDLWRP